MVVGKEKYDWKISASILKFWHLVIVKVEPELILDCLSKVLPLYLCSSGLEEHFIDEGVNGSNPFIGT